MQWGYRMVAMQGLRMRMVAMRRLGMGMGMWGLWMGMRAASWL